MRNIQQLDRTLLNSEFELSKALYEQLRGQGYAPYKAAAIIYRHGYLDGRDTQKDRVAEAYKRLNALKAEQAPTEQSPPEAIEEGRNEDEQQSEQ